MRTLLFFLLVATLLIGCSSSENSSHRRGKLSDAVEAASDENTGERTVDADFQEPESNSKPSADFILPEQKKEPIVTGFSDSAVYPPYELQPRTQTKQEYLDSIYHAKETPRNYYSEDRSDIYLPLSLGFNAAAGLLSSNEFYGMTTFGVHLSTPLERGMVGELSADMTIAPLQRTSILSHSIDDGIILFELSFQLRFPVTPEHTFIGQYFIAGGGANIMLWSYKNPIKAPVYTSTGTLNGYETISSDQLGGIDLFTGIGFDLTQTLPIHLIAEIRPGVLLWTGTTSEGFDNDIFANFAYLQFRFKVDFGSR